MTLFDAMEPQEDRRAQGQFDFQLVVFAMWLSDTGLWPAEEPLGGATRPGARPGATMQMAPSCQAGSGYLFAKLDRTPSMCLCTFPGVEWSTFVSIFSEKGQWEMDRGQKSMSAGIWFFQRFRGQRF